MPVAATLLITQTVSPIQHIQAGVTAGVWATLQFKWVQLQYPVVVLAFEKLLLGACLPVAATVQAWGVIAALGLAAAPFYLTVILAVLYCLFAMPLASSFAGGSRKMSIGQNCKGCMSAAAYLMHVTHDYLCLMCTWSGLDHTCTCKM